MEPLVSEKQPTISVTLTPEQFWRLKAAALQVQLWEHQVTSVLRLIEAQKRQLVEELGLSPDVSYTFDEKTLTVTPVPAHPPETR